MANCDGFTSKAYSVDLDTKTAERLKLNTRHGIANGFVDGQYMLLVVRDDQPVFILRDLVKVGQIKLEVNYYMCKNDHQIRGRYAQQAGHSVYVVDSHARLYRIDWQDIKDGKYRKKLVKENVDNFYVDERLGLATINKNDILNTHDSFNMNGTLNKGLPTLNLGDTMPLPSDTAVDLKAKVDAEASWTIVTCIAKCWIACGEHYRDGYAIMASVNDKGDIRSTLKLKLTSNGYLNDDGRKFAGIYSLHNAYSRGRRGIMLAIERDGCCHLISMVYGLMSKLQSIASIVPDVIKIKSDRIVHSVIATGIEGEFIVGGQNWTRRVSLKLK